MDKRKKKSTETRRTLLLVTATETEALFFSQMRKDCRYGNLTVVNSGAKDLRRLIQFTSREKNRNRYDVAYALFGLDDVGATIEDVREAQEACQGKRISLCWFNPSFLLCERGGEARAQEDKCGEISFVIHYVLVLVLQKTSCVQGWEDISSYRVFTLTFAKL